MKKKYNCEIPIICIVAMNQNRIIGDGQKLLWHIPGDLKRLKSITMGSPLIMGRKTWDSIGFPLPGRGSVVLTNSTTWESRGAIKASSFEEAITKSKQWLIDNENSKIIDVNKKIFLFGGAEIYRLGIEFCNTIEVTQVIFQAEQGPQFPFLKEENWNKEMLEHHYKTGSTPEFSYWRYNRKNNSL
ncbi:dihydrofolate reductase [Alphaproteobacteria bacterium]|nr:dihydrofolate reductase [Alphaproteobacteria bacterium]